MMRNHIVFKFLAVALCAAALVGAVGSGAGIFVMTEMDLYNRTVDEIYDARLESYALNYAMHVSEVYASRSLGGAGENLVNRYLVNRYFDDAWMWTVLDSDRVGYTLQDSEGNVLQSSPLPAKYRTEKQFSFPVTGRTGRYMKVLSETPRDVYYETKAPTVTGGDVTRAGDNYVYDAIPAYGEDVYFIDIVGSDGSEEQIASPADAPLGVLLRQENGTVEMLPATDYGDMEFSGFPVRIIFYTQDCRRIYEAASPEGVLESAEYREGHGLSLVLRNLTEETFVYDAIPPQGCYVSRISVTYADDVSESGGGAPNIGFVDYDESGSVRFTSVSGEALSFYNENVIQITLYDEMEELVYQAYDPAGVGSFHMEEPNTEQQRMVFLSGTAVQALETVPMATVPAVTTPTYEEPQQPMDYEIYEYFDDTADQWMVAEFTWETMPAYTVTLSMAQGALRDESQFALLRLLSSIGNQLPAILGISLLAFAILAVYLCCTAGRKPKSEEVHPGGLNCIPLDLYLVMAGFGVVGLAFIATEAIPEILGEVTVTLVVGGLLAYGASLLIVGFCFACAAQFKTPGGYWWRHSFCVFCLKLVGKLFRLLGLALRKIGGWLKKAGKCLGRKANRFYSLLPLTWQWLLVGIGLVVLLFLAVFNRRNGFVFLLCMGAAIVVILYGAKCFGTLMESAKRMSKGNLDEKVDDKWMIGAFQEFAGDLNSLADVAVVAAREQLKSERMKTELITNVSHDIKTPLTSIINYVDLLQKPHTAEEQEEYLEVLDRQSQRLKKLIDDLIEMSKASTGNLPVDITRVDAVEAVNQALGEFADKLEKADLFPVFRQPEQPVFMMADGRLVWRVMSNLLSNAVKYALPGTRLYVDLQKLDSKVILSLKNISREELNVNADELLERFVRGDASRNTEGSGLGLNIAQSLMELQKGQLQILVDGDLFKVTLIFPGAE